MGAQCSLATFLALVSSSTSISHSVLKMIQAISPFCRRNSSHSSGCPQLGTLRIMEPDGPYICTIGTARPFNQGRRNTIRTQTWMRRSVSFSAALNRMYMRKIISHASEFTSHQKNDPTGLLLSGSCGPSTQFSQNVLPMVSGLREASPHGARNRQKASNDQASNDQTGRSEQLKTFAQPTAARLIEKPISASQ